MKKKIVASIITSALIPFALAEPSDGGPGKGGPGGHGKGKGGPPSPEKIIEHLDDDGNGTVSEAEFLDGPRAKKDPDKAKDHFARIDADGDGEATLEEFETAHKDRKGKKGGKGGKGKKGGDDTERPEAE